MDRRLQTALRRPVFPGLSALATATWSRINIPMFYSARALLLQHEPYAEGPLDDGSDDRAHDRDERPHRHYHRLVAAFQRSWIDTMSLLRRTRWFAESRS